MAIEKEVPKDIRKYEAKLVGPFTTRQLVCFVPAALIAVFAFTTLRKYIPQDACFFVSTLFAAPLLLVGWYKPYGMPLEKFIKSAFISTILSPTNRKYITVNFFDVINKKAKEMEMHEELDARGKKKKSPQSTKKAKKSKKSKQYIAYR